MADETTWRIYRTEWLVSYVSDGFEVEGQEECKAVFAEKYQGRVRDEDWRVVGLPGLRPRRHVLQVRLPNLKGEFKDHGDALELASRLMDGYKEGPCDLVRRGSDEEQALLDYGKKMLPSGG